MRERRGEEGGGRREEKGGGRREREGGGIEAIKTDFSAETSKLREEIEGERQTKARIMTWYGERRGEEREEKGEGGEGRGEG